MSENFDIKYLTISQLLDSRSELSKAGYEIPGFQRPYTWGQEEVQSLLNDIEQFILQRESVQHENDESSEKYFIGTIILLGKVDNKKTKQIIDGAQRMTTLTLMLKEMFFLLAYVKDKFEKRAPDFEKKLLGDSTPLESLNALLVSSIPYLIWKAKVVNGFDILNPNLVSKIQENSDGVILRDILTHVSDSDTDQNEKDKKKESVRDYLLPTFKIKNSAKEEFSSSIYKFSTNSELLRKWLAKIFKVEEIIELVANVDISSQQYTKEAEDLINGILKRVNLIINDLSMVVVFAPKVEQALKIFETINSRGVQLSSIDLFKERLYNLLKSAGEQEEFLKKWKSLTEICTCILNANSSGNNKKDEKLKKELSKIFSLFVLNEYAKTNSTSVSMKNYGDLFFSKTEIDNVLKRQEFTPEDSKIFVTKEECAIEEDEFINFLKPIEFIDRLILIAKFICFVVYLREINPTALDRDNNNLKNKKILSEIWNEFSWLANYKSRNGHSLIVRLLDLIRIADIDALSSPLNYYLLHKVNRNEKNFEKNFEEFLKKYSGLVFVRHALDIDMKPLYLNISADIYKYFNVESFSMLTNGLPWSGIKEHNSTGINLNQVEKKLKDRLEELEEKIIYKPKNNTFSISNSAPFSNLISFILNYYLVANRNQNTILPKKLDVEHINAKATKLEATPNKGYSPLDYKVIESLGNKILLEPKINKSIKDLTLQFKAKKQNKSSNEFSYEESDLASVRDLSELIVKDGREHWDEETVRARENHIIQVILQFIAKNGGDNFVNPPKEVDDFLNKSK